METDIIKKFEEFNKKIEKLEKGKKDQVSIIVFSGDFDKLLAAFVISLGARAMDLEVRLFFTFWGVAALRDKKKKVNGKDFMSRMFGMMLPKGSTKVKLSQMNMAGMGTKMMRSLMKKKGVTSLEDMIKAAGEMGVVINICEMSMGLMGIKKEELIDYPDLGICGVGTYLSDAEESKIQLFI